MIPQKDIERSASGERVGRLAHGDRTTLTREMRLLLPPLPLLVLLRNSILTDL